MGVGLIMLEGGAVYYRTNLQPTIAQSSLEAKFTTMADSGKVLMYIFWILDELENHRKYQHNLLSIKIASA